MELAHAFGTTPHSVAAWPWGRVYRYWNAWRKRDRRELRVRTYLAHQSGLGAMAAMFGGGAPSNSESSSDRQILNQFARSGVPIKRVKAGD